MVSTATHSKKILGLITGQGAAGTRVRFSSGLLGLGVVSLGIHEKHTRTACFAFSPTKAGSTWLGPPVASDG